MYGRLRGLCLLLAMHIGNKGYMDEGEVLVPDAELELSHRFDERRGLNVTDSPTELSSQDKWVYYDRNVDIRTSTMQTSGSSPVLSTGILETRSIQSCIAFVTCGTI